MVFVASGAPSPAEVVRLIQSGRFGEALAMGRKVLAGRGNDPQLLQLVAIAAMQSGAATEGIDLLRRAHALNSRDPAIAFNLAKALGDAGRIDEALALSRGNFSGQLDFQRLAAELARRAGRHAEARQAYERLLQHSPGDADLLNNLATACMALDDTPAALAALDKARSIAPASIPVLLNLAKAHSLSGNLEEALNHAHAAFERAPQDPLVTLELGRVLKLADRVDEALQVLVAALDRNRESGDLALEIGMCFSAKAEFDRAEEAYRQAIKIDPRNAQAYLSLGILLEQANQLEPLDDLLALAVANAVQGPEIEFLTALALRRKGALEEARRQVSRPDPEEAVNPAVRSHLQGLIEDQLGNAAAAFQAFSEMNRHAAQSLRGRALKGDDYYTYIAGVSEAVTPDWVRSWPELAGPGRKSPAFLVGFPRSGTTLLDTMLMGHPALHVLEEEPVLAAVHGRLGSLLDIPSLGQLEVDALRDAYFSGVEELGAVPAGNLIVDKLPLNLLRVPLIQRLFPDARFILALRHPCDAVLSCFMQNFQVNRAMASFWTIEQAAKTYDAAFSFWERCRAAMPMQVEVVRYEDLIADRELELARLAGFLGVPYDDAMADYRSTARERGRVRTPSYAQITEGVYQRARGRWERYRKQMEPALPHLAPWAERFGYGDLGQQ